MSDLDDYLLTVLKSDASPKEIYNEIQAIFEDDKLIRSLPVSEPEHQLDRNHKYGVYHYHLKDACLTPASIAAHKGGDELFDVVKLLVEEGGNDPTQPLWVVADDTCPNRSVALVRYLLRQPNVDLSFKLTDKTSSIDRLLDENFSLIKDARKKLLEAIASATNPIVSSDAVQVKGEAKESKLETDGSYAAMVAAFAAACNADRTFVIEYLAHCLDEIAIGTKKEKDYPFLVSFTNELFEIFSNDSEPDPAAEKEFKDGLLIKWLGYKPHEDGFFKTDIVREQFLRPLYRNMTPKNCFYDQTNLLDHKTKAYHQVASQSGSPIYAARSNPGITSPSSGVSVVELKKSPAAGEKEELSASSKSASSMQSSSTMVKN